MHSFSINKHLNLNLKRETRRLCQRYHKYFNSWSEFSPSLVAIYFSPIGIGETCLNEKPYFVPQEEGSLLVSGKSENSRPLRPALGQLGWKRRREEGNVETATRRGYRERRVVWSRKKRTKERRWTIRCDLVGRARSRDRGVFSIPGFRRFHNFSRVCRECFSEFSPSSPLSLSSFSPLLPLRAKHKMTQNPRRHRMAGL